MKYNILCIASLIILLTINGVAQNKKGHSNSPIEETPYFIKDGVKMSKKNNTPLVIVNINDNVKGNTPSEMAFSWVEINKELLQVENVGDLKVYFKRSSLSGHNIRLRQFYNNIPVFNSEIVVHISPSNTVTYVGNTFDPSVQQISTTPSISENQAFQIAKTKIKANGKMSYSSTELYIYNLLKKSKLIYKIIIESDIPIGSWEVLVDAQNGNIIKSEDKAYYYEHPKTVFFKPQPLPAPTNGTGNVFLSDPLSFANVSYGGNYVDNNDATNAQLDAARASVTLLDIDNTAGTYSLKGPYAEIKDFENPSTGLFTQASGTFNFNRFDDAFEAVNCYFLIDNNMRYINQTLGITLMPFQYAGGVRYDPHGLSGADNSHYLGGSGQLAFGEGCVDDAEDADVVIHELGHGIHDWLTGGNLSQVNGLSEGSGDYWGQSYSRSLGQWTSSDPEYQWFFNWDGHNACWNGRITNYTATYPGGLVGAIHTDGQIWATTLMRIYDILGREKVDKAFLEGLGMTGSSTSQQDAAIAVRQAAIDMGYSCPDIDVFTQEFTATGYNMPALNLAQFPPVVNDTTVCDGPAAIIFGNGNSLNWYDDFTLTNLLFTGNNLNTGQSTAATYTYYVKYSDAACSVAPSDTVILTINSCSSTANLVISEIMYNPPEAGTDSLEFIEIYNNGPVSVNLNNYTFTQGVTYTFPNSSIIAGGYYIVAKDSVAFLNVYGLSPNGEFSGALTNGGEDIVIADNLGNTIDSVDYDNAGPWPSGTTSGNPDGGGASIILCDVTSDNNIGSNWFPSTNSIGQTINGFAVLASPGAGNNCCPIIVGSVTNTICNNESISVNGTTYNAGNPSGTEVFTVAMGCDSTVTINLNVLTALTGSVTNTICDGDVVVVNGTTYNASNPSGSEVFPNIGPNNCDSTVTINLTVTIIDTSTNITGLTISSNQNGATYQWIDCNNGNISIPSETNQSYIATTNGDYAVVISVGSCSDTSACVNISSVGINESINTTNINIYPNPTTGFFTISLDKILNNTTIMVYDILGKEVIKKSVVSKQTTLNLTGKGQGIYFVKIQNEADTITRKIVLH